VADRAPIYPVSRRHLETLSDEVGIIQHARGALPDLTHGYCTDDVARALLVDLLHAAELGWAEVAPSAWRALRFLESAFADDSGRVRNLRGKAGDWLIGPSSEDAHARAIMALGQATRVAPDDRFRSLAISLFQRGLPGIAQLRYLRPQAAALIGCEAAVASGLGGETEAAYRLLAATLWRGVESGTTPGPWPWPEPVLTYENGLIPRALIIGGHRLGYPYMVRRGLDLLAWLVDVETSTAGYLSVVGNAGWWPRNGVRARYDQQPIEATALLLAAAAALEVTGGESHRLTMERCYGWFLGRNDGDIVIALPERGACHDGLTPSGVNRNQGAESSLMWLIALERIRQLRRTSDTRICDAVAVNVPL
jgi:hypothetical protein